MNKIDIVRKCRCSVLCGDESVVVGMMRLNLIWFTAGTCNFFQVTGQITTLKWSRGQILSHV